MMTQGNFVPSQCRLRTFYKMLVSNGQVYNLVYQSLDELKGRYTQL